MCTDHHTELPLAQTGGGCCQSGTTATGGTSTCCGTPHADTAPADTAELRSATPITVEAS